MKFALPVWSLVLVTILAAVGITACTQQQADKAQTKIAAIEAATTQAAAVAAPVSPTTEQILLALLAGEKLIGSYIVPLLVKAAKAGNVGTGDTLALNSNTSSNTTTTPIKT